MNSAAPHAAAADDLVITSRTHTDSGSVEKTEKWKTAKSAVIVCDMWDAHHCLNAVKRVNEMAPRMNQLLKKMREGGATIIHAPSSCVDFYRDHPARRNAIGVPRSQNLPTGIGQWCDHIPAEKDYPLDQTDGGEDDAPDEHKKWAAELTARGRNPRAPWKRQVATLEIADADFITDNGEEVWSILEARQISNVLMVGVHTNMCVLGRPFGLRQLSSNGKNVILVRDLTDTMYNPARWPFVDHYQGNRLIQRHIEKYVCGTTTSDQVLGGQPFRFSKDQPRKCVVLCAEWLYGTDKTLKKFADKILSDQLGFQTKILIAAKGQPGPEKMQQALSDADLVVLSMRRRALPASDLKAFRKYLERGKPLVAIRTSSHAFDTRGNHPQGHAEWQDFDTEVLGGDYTGHHPNGITSRITTVGEHPILTGVSIRESAGSLYRSSPLGSRSQPLLMGEIGGKPGEPVAWTNQFGKSRVFYTSLGSQSDFDRPGFLRLLENGCRWASGMKIGSEPNRKK
ncbi:MAG: isochorismatase family protein [Planctomycetota bacterium]|nr:isochorismatase family protein [Planctomycetota bacterium]